MNRKILIIGIIALVMDQITKILAESYLILNKSVVVIDNFFSLTLCRNQGAAWGILKDRGWIIIVFSILAILLIYHFIYCFKNNMRNNIAFGLLFGGLEGNLLDRIIFGYVRDFMDFYLFKYDFPVFNVADICIVVGVILLVIAIIKGEDLSENSSRRNRRKTRQVSSK